jgi:hypothetical protein
MAPVLDSMTRHAYEVRLLGIALLALAVVAVVLVASIAFDWTLASGPSFDLTTNPGADLPF